MKYGHHKNGSWCVASQHDCGIQKFAYMVSNGEGKKIFK